MMQQLPGRQFVFSALLLIVFIVLILPFTGILGGLVWLLAGWLFPSLINLLVTAFVVTSIRPGVWQYVLFLLVSFLLAAGVEAPAVWQQVIHPAASEALVTSPAKLDPTRQLVIAGDLTSAAAIASNPLEARIAPGADEGCGCMYWRPGDNYVQQHLSSELAAATGKTISLGTSTGARTFISFSIEPHHDDSKLADIRIEVHEGDAVVASLHQPDLIWTADLQERTNGRRILNGYFFRNVGHVLCHGTFWSPVVALFMDRDLRSFLDKVLVT